jgi:hypothetical protein
MSRRLRSLPRDRSRTRVEFVNSVHRHVTRTTPFPFRFFHSHKNPRRIAVNAFDIGVARRLLPQSPRDFAQLVQGETLMRSLLFQSILLLLLCLAAPRGAEACPIVYDDEQRVACGGRSLTGSDDNIVLLGSTASEKLALNFADDGVLLTTPAARLGEWLRSPGADGPSLSAPGRPSGGAPQGLPRPPVATGGGERATPPPHPVDGGAVTSPPSGESGGGQGSSPGGSVDGGAAVPPPSGEIGGGGGLGSTPSNPVVQVPEPSLMVLLGVGFLALGWRTRRAGASS